MAIISFKYEMMEMPLPKKPRLLSSAPADNVGTDEMVNILSFLRAKDIMRSRRVCKKWREAAKKTIVPYSTGYDFCRNNFTVDSLKKYNAMKVMMTAMPNLQQIELRWWFGGEGHKYVDGGEPDEDLAAETADCTAHDIEFISNFSKLRSLEICRAPLNGGYYFLFRFPLLQRLVIDKCHYLWWDLKELVGLPLLKELRVTSYTSLPEVTGNISSLGVLKNTLEIIELYNCVEVEGNLMDLADFPFLKKLELYSTAVKGDVRDIGENDFTMIERLYLPVGVFGNSGCVIGRYVKNLLIGILIVKFSRTILGAGG